METPEVSQDPNTVLERLSKLELGTRAAEISEPSTPAESPTPLNQNIREWLSDKLGASAHTSLSLGKVYAKLLVSNAAAGSIIGKGGGNINDFQKKTSARIQLSKAGEYYPGTTERTLLVSGKVKQILGALSLIFKKLLREGVAPVTPRSRAIIESHQEEVEGIRLSLKLLVPQQLCGIIIGRGGATVKAYSQQTATQIRVIAPEGSAVASNHRIVTVNGAQEAVLKAVALLIIKQAEDPQFASFSDLPMSWTAQSSPNALPSHYESSQYSMSLASMAHHYQQQYYMNGANNNGHILYPMMFASSPDGLTTMTCQFTEEVAMAVLGHGQRSPLGIEEIQAHTGVKVSMNRMEDTTGNAAAGNGQNAHTSLSMYQMTLYGNPEAVLYANSIIQQRLQGAMVQQYPGHYVNPASAYGYNVRPGNFAHYSPIQPSMPSYGIGDDEYGRGGRR